MFFLLFHSHRTSATSLCVCVCVSVLSNQRWLLARGCCCCCSKCIYQNMFVTALQTYVKVHSFKSEWVTRKNVAAQKMQDEPKKRISYLRKTSGAHEGERWQRERISKEIVLPQIERCYLSCLTNSNSRSNGGFVFFLFVSNELKPYLKGNKLNI